MAMTIRYCRDRYYYIHVEVNGHVADIERALCVEAPVILMTLDGESKGFFPVTSNADDMRVLPSEQMIEHHFMADPLYILANHAESDVMRFVFKAFGKLDEPILNHCYTIPKWYSIA